MRHVRQSMFPGIFGGARMSAYRGDAESLQETTTSCHMAADLSKISNVVNFDIRPVHKHGDKQLRMCGCDLQIECNHFATRVYLKNYY